MSKENNLVPRYYGSETEYGYVTNDGKLLSHSDWKIPPGVKYLPGGNQPGGFLSNGSRFYLDCQLVEYATPECPTLKDIVTHEIAGERLIWDAFGDSRSRVSSFHKRSRTPGGRYTLGSHENYTTSINIALEVDKQIDGLATHFSTRTIFLGAGQPTPDGYVIGQKIHDIMRDSGSGNTTNKALVNTRSEHHGGGAVGLQRLHVVSGDANVSPWAIYMKYGTTSLILRLLEQGVDLSGLALKDPLIAAKLVAGDIRGMSKPLALKNSEKNFSALDIQEELANQAFALSQKIELPLEEQQVIFEWPSAVDALRRYSKTGDHQKEIGQIDWYTKMQIIEGRKQKDEYKSKDKEAQQADENMWDLHYDMIPDGWGVKLRQEGKRYSQYAPSETDVQRAKTTPPESRAKLRGALIERVHEKDVPHLYLTDWGNFGLKGVPACSTKMPIDARYTDEEVATIVNDL